MTDTQEEMREFDFDKWWDEVAISLAKQFAENCIQGWPVHVQRSVLSYCIARAAVKAATAQSAEKIARLEEIIRLTYKQWVGRDFEHLPLNEAVGAAIEKQLAAAELSNKQLRDILEDFARGQLQVPNFEAYVSATAKSALAQPISTEALDAYVAGKMAGMQRTTDHLISRTAPLPPAPEKE